VLIKQLYIAGFRNIEAANIETDKRVNVFYGKNGSGKTSILESLFYLGRAKSFRTNKKSEIVKTGMSDLVVSAKLDQKENEHRLGIQLDESGNNRLKLDGEILNRLSEASTLVPSQLITPESFDVFWSSPKARRSFLDFGLFHVEHEYQKLWAGYVKLLKQTNALLRQGNASLREIEYWYEAYLVSANKIDDLRETFLTEHFSEAIRLLTEEIKDQDKAELIRDIQVKYKRKNLNLNELTNSKLKQVLDREQRYKQVGYGPNRADITFIKNNEDISAKLSRGQAKMMFYLLEVAMVNIVSKVTNKNIAVLVDDLPSEVDPETRGTMIEMLLKTKAQIFVTGIENKIAMEFNKYTDSINVFHVEHGKISAINMEQLCP
jgi:DNA replication and repair protein RecF